MGNGAFGLWLKLPGKYLSATSRNIHLSLNAKSLLWLSTTLKATGQGKDEILLFQGVSSETLKNSDTAMLLTPK